MSFSGDRGNIDIAAAIKKRCYKTFINVANTNVFYSKVNFISLEILMYFHHIFQFRIYLLLESGQFFFYLHLSQRDSSVRETLINRCLDLA